MTAERRRGAFITIEGGEGGGKSTQTKALVGRLKQNGIEAVATREPGGSDAAELIRTALLAGQFELLGLKAEALLFAAARIDHLDLKIKPALDAGSWVVCDRFHDSTRAYQGAHGGVEEAFMAELERVSLAGLLPDLTLILDLPAQTGLSRVARRRADHAVLDRFEKQSLEFHQNPRAALLDSAEHQPKRCAPLAPTPRPDDVEQAIWDAVAHRLPVPSRPEP